MQAQTIIYRYNYMYWENDLPYFTVRLYRYDNIDDKWQFYIQKCWCSMNDCITPQDVENRKYTIINEKEADNYIFSVEL